MASKIETRVTETERRLDKHDVKIAAIQKLIWQGMKMAATIQQQQKRNEAQIEETWKQIRETNKTLDRFIRSLEGRGGNGHSKSKIDLR